MFTLLIKMNNRTGVTLLIVLAMMVMFAMLVTTFMVIVTQHRKNAELYANILTGVPPRGLDGGARKITRSSIQRGQTLDIAFQRLLTGSEKFDNVIAPYSIIENFVGSTEDSERFPVVPFGGTRIPIATAVDDEENPLALRPNILAPHAFSVKELQEEPFTNYGEYLLKNGDNVRMNPGYTAPDYTTMFLAWNDVKKNDEGDVALHGVIPSYHRPQLVEYWQNVYEQNSDPDRIIANELRKYVLRPLPTDHPDFTGSNPAAKWDNTQTDPEKNRESLIKFLTEGPWDVDNDGDGKADGIWLDIGLPAKQDLSGRWYKPLVSYYVIDLDGRINVNAIGNLEMLVPPDNASGMGLGTAELYSELLDKEDIKKVLEERYGSDKKPGGSGIDLLKNNGINLDAYTRGGVVADWFGTSPMDNFDDLGNRKPPQTLISETNISEIPYLMNPYQGSDNTDDTPFEMGKHLEPFLRSIFEVGHTLPERLRELLDPYDHKAPTPTSPDLRYSLTTRSNDIPVAAPLYDRVLELVGNDQAKADALWNLLPEEIRHEKDSDLLRPEKVDINRLTLLPNWAVHWNGGDRNALLKEKVQFAQEIFFLLRVLLHEQIKEQKTLERLAQWSVNLVDFIDPDDVMTPFIFSTDLTLDSIDNTNLDRIDKLLTGDLSANDLNGRMLIWGMEKSEVVLTETLAMHNRAVAQRPSDDSFRQYAWPQGSLFVELHRQGNPQRNYSASSLVEPGNGRLNLAKRTGASGDGDYVWRIAIGETTKTTAGKFTWDDDDHPERNALRQLLSSEGGSTKYPQFYQWWYPNPNTEGTGEYRPDLGVPERFIWFGELRTDTDAEIVRRSFVRTIGDNTALDLTALDPNDVFVIAPREITHSALAPSLDILPRWIDVSDMTNKWMVAATPFASEAVRDIGVNISEPLPPPSLMADGYAAQLQIEFTPFSNINQAPEPFDGRLTDTIRRQRGTIPSYKTICLQRLADPLRPHHAICNPYLTVDWSMIDLQVINSITKHNDSLLAEEPSSANFPVDSDMHFSSRQWKQETSSGVSNLWDKTLTADKLKGKEGKAGLEVGPAAYTHASNGHLTNAPSHTLGTSNYSTPFMHFPWSDAPFMNTGELMLVPSSAPGRFGVEFHDNGKGNDFFGEKNRFGYYHDESNSAFSVYFNWKDSDLNLPLLLDFVHVPSRFAGTREETSDGSLGRTYREPGKINLNTVTEEGWKALQNGRETFPDYSTLESLRHNSGEPHRSAMSTLLGLDMINNAADNPYTALENVMRLSDVTTTRSNVFAIWITVGYFNVKKVGNLAELQKEYPGLNHITDDDIFKAVYPDGYVLEAELGLDDATVKRHRAFYLIDRSNLIDLIRAPTVTFKRGTKLTEDEKQRVVFKETALD